MTARFSFISGRARGHRPRLQLLDNPPRVRETCCTYPPIAFEKQGADPKGGQMKRIFVSITSISLISFLTCASLWAQATAEMSGTIRDSSGAVLPGVQVTATQTDTGISRTAVSNETGSYVLSNLSPGPYRLEASLPGFRTYARTGIVLQVGSNPVMNISMAVGQVSETVEVQANAAFVETQSTGISQVIETQRILELPLNGRQATDLIVLAGSAVNQGAATSLSMNGGVRISVAGGQSF